MYFDGSKRNMGTGAGVVLISPQGDMMKYVLSVNFALPTKNEVECEALLHSMRMANACGSTRLDIYGDSNLVVKHSMNLCDAISDNMIDYRQMYQSMETKFDGCELKHNGKASKEEADALDNIGSTCSAIPDGVFYEVINQRSIKVKTVAPLEKSTIDLGAAPQDDAEDIVIGPEQQVLLLEPIRTKPFLTYLLRQELPYDPTEARRIARCSKAFTVELVNFTSEVYLVYSNGASSSKMEMHCCRRYMKEHVVAMQAVEHLWPKLSELSFIGQQQQSMQEIWSGSVTPVSVSHQSHMPLLLTS
jgi:ribonuclease HI